MEDEMDDSLTDESDGWILEDEQAENYEGKRIDTHSDTEDEEARNEDTYEWIKEETDDRLDMPEFGIRLSCDEDNKPKLDDVSQWIKQEEQTTGYCEADDDFLIKVEVKEEPTLNDAVIHDKDVGDSNQENRGGDFLEVEIQQETAETNPSIQNSDIAGKNFGVTHDNVERTSASNQLTTSQEDIALQHGNKAKDKSTKNSGVPVELQLEGQNNLRRKVTSTNDPDESSTNNLACAPETIAKSWGIFGFVHSAKNEAHGAKQPNAPFSDQFNKALAKCNLVKLHRHVFRRYCACQYCKNMLTILNRHEQANRFVKQNQCIHCGEQFPLPSILKMHERTHLADKHIQYLASQEKTSVGMQKHIQVYERQDHNGEKLYKCMQCGESFKVFSTFRRHELDVHLQKYYQCELCNQNLHDFSALKIHRKLHDRPTCTSEPQQCQLCRQVFWAKSRLKRHTNCPRRQKTFKCKICPKILPNNSSLKRHQLVHSAAKPYLCSHCPKSFKSLYYLKFHEKQHRSEMTTHGRNESRAKPHQCEICLKSFTSRSNSKRHESVHSNATPYLCNHCPKSFKSLYYLKSHEKEHRSEMTTHGRNESRAKPHQCEVCRKSFTSRSNLKRHESVHSTATPYLCNLCPRSFKSLYYLKSHEKEHRSEMTTHGRNESRAKPYQCEVCRKSFICRSKLKRHESVHSTATPYLCNLCPKSFKSLYYLKSHEKKHRSEMTTHGRNESRAKPHQCEVCRKSFKSAEYLRLHGNVHSKRYQCNVCLTSYISARYLKIHERRHTNTQESTNLTTSHRSNIDRKIDDHITNHPAYDREVEKLYQNSQRVCESISSSSNVPSDISQRDLDKSEIDNIRVNNNSTGNSRSTESETDIRLAHLFLEELNRREELKRRDERKMQEPYKRKHERRQEACKQVVRTSNLCQHCGKTFRRLGTLKRHEIVHKKEKPRKCCKICFTTFTKVSTFQKHVRKHTAQMPLEAHVNSHPGK